MIIPTLRRAEASIDPRDFQASHQVDSAGVRTVFVTTPPAGVLLDAQACDEMAAYLEASANRIRYDEKLVAALT